MRLAKEADTLTLICINISIRCGASFGCAEEPVHAASNPLTTRSRCLKLSNERAIDAMVGGGVPCNATGGLRRRLQLGWRYVECGDLAIIVDHGKRASQRYRLQCLSTGQPDDSQRATQ